MKRFFLALFALFLSCAQVNAAITAVALLGTGHTSSNSTNVGTTVTNNCAAGSTIIVAVATVSASNVLVSVADGSSNTYQTAIDVIAGTGVSVGIGYAVNTTTAVNIGNTITATLFGATGSLMSAICVQGLSTTTPLDIHNQNVTGTGTSSAGPNSGTLNDTNEIVIGVAGYSANQGTPACGGSFTSFGTNAGSPASGRFCYQIVASSASVNFQPTWVNNVNFVLDIATFDTNGGGGGGPSPHNGPLRGVGP